MQHHYILPHLTPLHHDNTFRHSGASNDSKTISGEEVLQMHKNKPADMANMTDMADTIDMADMTDTIDMINIVLQIVNQNQNEPAAKVEEIVEKGSVNRVFSVKTEQGDRILRLRECKEYPSAYWEYQKEKWCLVQAQKAGIPSPDVLEIGEHHDVAYMMETCVPGVNGHLLPEQSIPIWQKLGQHAPRFNQINVSGFGADIHQIMLLDAFDKLRWAIDRSPSDVTAFSRVARQVFAINCNDEHIIAINCNI